MVNNTSGALMASMRLLHRVDHLVYATPDLPRTIDELEARLGIRANPGGQHPGRGTRNAVMALGSATYLEILAPDPEQPMPETPRWFGVDYLEMPQLVGWAASANDLDKLARRAELHGVKLGAIVSGSRRRLDGTVLSWCFTDPCAGLADGIAPFFIDWGKTPHPASSAPQGAALIDFRAEHPDPRRVQATLDQLGLDLRIAAGRRARLIAIIVSARGRVELS